MKYTSEVTIDLPRERVIELFDDSDNLSKWQPGLQSFEALMGIFMRGAIRKQTLEDMNRFKAFAEGIDA